MYSMFPFPPRPSSTNGNTFVICSHSIMDRIARNNLQALTSWFIINIRYKNMETNLERWVIRVLPPHPANNTACHGWDPVSIVDRALFWHCQPFEMDQLGKISRETRIPVAQHLSISKVVEKSTCGYVSVVLMVILGNQVYLWSTFNLFENRFSQIQPMLYKIYEIAKQNTLVHWNSELKCK